MYLKHWLDNQLFFKKIKLIFYQILFCIHVLWAYSFCWTKITKNIWLALTSYFLAKDNSYLEDVFELMWMCFCFSTFECANRLTWSAPVCTKVKVQRKVPWSCAVSALQCKCISGHNSISLCQCPFSAIASDWHKWHTQRQFFALLGSSSVWWPCVGVGGEEDAANEAFLD